MRRFSSLAPRAKPALKDLPQQSLTTNNFIKKKNPTKQINTTSIWQQQIRNDNIASPSSGKLTSPSVSSDKRTKFIDRGYISQILSRNDWYLLLNHEFKAKRINLVPQFIVSVLQNQENPLHSLRFYIWVSNIDPFFAKNQTFKGVLANTLYRKGPVVLSIELLQDIRNSGFRVSEDLLCILVSSWGRLGLAKYTADIFGQISFLGICPSTRLYNAVIDALVKSNSLDLAYLNFQQMSMDNCKPDRFTYNILIHGVCRIGVVDEALRLVKQMSGMGYAPNVFTYTILVDGFCNAKRVDDAFQVVENMKKRNVSPSEATIRSLVHGVFRSEPPPKAFELVVRFMEREPIFRKLACDTLIYCLSNNSMAREVAVFLRKAVDRGYLPDSSTLNVAMTCLLKGFDLIETCKILDSFNKQGVKVGFSTSLALIEALYKAGRGLDGDRYFNQMVKDGLVSNVCSYNMVIDCFCKADMMDRAVEIFEDMQHRAVAPNLITFNTLISGHCKDGEISKAREMLSKLLDSEFKPDIFTFSSIIDGLCRAHHIEDAFNCFDEMVEWGVSPNAVIYNILIRSLCVIGDVARSMRIFRKMQAVGIKPDSYSFNELIRSFCRMKKVEKAEKLFLSMLTLGLNPDNYTYGAFIKALHESGRLEEAKKMFLSMEATGCVPDSYTSNLVADILVQHGSPEEAQSIASASHGGESH
ncbi:PPR domain-containing protein/PPR_2 domain-containing protein/PPR_3 domain-containing protein [Cephalotus follicularis]|uniref:PPR domain-containing protein/PPR_2 domain-containing protein/PPR_3 domain-containing protein n=1 Tax=Cephalotus follicularis TaxID=3775 RepID=A0A1Q3DG65_CEPFO|nr:PPR domain-containing protein/PPR_2 domain-containing protein/PPR_3 domain-containing protein [Cephalotus follicularis]